MSNPSVIEHLYVHVPFCAAKCDYCAFYSEAGAAGQMGDYVEALLREFSGWTGQLKPRTVFFGGGTPSVLPAPLLRRILETLYRSLPQAQLSEWTIECNPATVSTEKANLFRECGVNRLSLGVQALDDDLLRVIGRVHSAKMAVESYQKLRAAGFDNVNLDLMFGLPGQTLEQFRATLQQVIALLPEHIATYNLILEEDTEFWRRYGTAGFRAPSSDGQAGSLAHLALPTVDEELAMYELAIEMLTAAGYRHYEISNFARPGRECAHNIAYWEGKDYLGLGPSACSTVGDRRWQNVADIASYTAAIREQRSAISFTETLTPAVRASERVAFGMRMLDGVPADWVRGRWDREIAALLSAELVQWRQGRLQPTKRGVLFADTVAAEFVSVP